MNIFDGTYIALFVVFLVKAVLASVVPYYLLN